MDIASLKIAIDSRDAIAARRDLAGVESQAGKTEQATERMAKKSSQALGDMSGFIGRVVGTLTAANLAQQFIKTADSVTILNNQLKLAMGGAEAAGQAYKDLYIIAQQSRVSFTDLGGTFAQIRRATEDTGLSYGRLLTVTEAIGNAMAVSGGSAQGMNAALIQLQQGLASGTLRGEELNSVMEQTPRLAQAIADGLGITRSQLRAMGQDGKLTSEAVIRALESQAGILKGEVANATLTAGQAYTVMANATTKLLGQFDQLTGASAGVASAMKSIGLAMDGLGAFIENNKAGILAITGALAGVAVVAGIMKMAGAIELVKTAFIALTGVMASNPAGLVLLGIGAVGGAIAGMNAYNNALAKTREGMVETIKRLEETNKSVEKSIYGPPTAGAMQHIEARRKQIEGLRKEIEKLDAAAYKAGGGSGSVGSGDTALMREQGKAYAALAGERQKFIDGAMTATQKMNVELEKARTAFGGMIPQNVEEAIRGKYAGAIKKATGAIEAGKLRNKLVEENAKLHKDSLKPFEQSLEAQIKRVESLQTEEAAVKMARDLNVSLAQAVEMVNIAKLKEQQIAAMGNPEAVAAIEREIEERKKLIDLIGSKEARDASTKAAEKAEADWKRTAEKIEDALTDSLMRGFEKGKDFGQNLKDTLENMFKTMVLRPIIQASVGGLGMGGTSGSIAGTLGGIGNFAGLATAFGGALSSGFSMALSGGMGIALEGGAAMLGSATGISSALAGIGQIAGALGPIALAFAAIPVISGMFDGGKEYTTGTGISGTLSNSGFSGRNYQSWKNDGSSGFFGIGASGSSTGTNYSAMDNMLQRSIGTAFGAIITQTAGFAKALGENSDMVMRYSQDISIAMGSDAAANKAALENALKTVAANVSATIVQAQYIRDGETASDTIARLATNLTAVNGSFDALGKSLLSVSQYGGDAASKLVEAFGGLQNYQSALSSYYQAFYSEEERNAKTREQTAKTFKTLNIAMPDTLANFRKLVDSQDVTTEAGRSTFAALMALSPAFAQTASSVDKIKDAWKSIGDSLLEEATRIRGVVATESGYGLAYLQSEFAILTAATRAGNQVAGGKLSGVASAISEAAAMQATSALELAVMRSNVANSLEQTNAIVTGAPVSVNTPILTANTAEDTKAMRAQIEALNARISELTTNTKAENQAQFTALNKLVSIMDTATQGGSMAVRTINGETVKTV